MYRSCFKPIFGLFCLDVGTWSSSDSPESLNDEGSKIFLTSSSTGDGLGTSVKVQSCCQYGGESPRDELRRLKMRGCHETSLAMHYFCKRGLKFLIILIG